MFSRIQALPSVMDWLGHVSPGGEVTRTVDYFTCPGVFYLASVSREQVAADAAMIRELEMTGLYG